jgi:hypothetical protein
VLARQVLSYLSHALFAFVMFQIGSLTFCLVQPQITTLLPVPPLWLGIQVGVHHCAQLVLSFKATVSLGY